MDSCGAVCFNRGYRGDIGVCGCAISPGVPDARTHKTEPQDKDPGMREYIFPIIAIFTILGLVLGGAILADYYLILR